MMESHTNFFPFKKPPIGLSSLTSCTTNPETFRIIAYIGFWIMVLVGFILTFLFVPETELEQSALVKTFGYNNICILLDYAPSLYWTSMIFTYIELSFYLYIFLIWMRTLKAYQQEIVDYRFMLFSTVVSVIEALLLSWFHMIFVISASVDILGHSLPFIGLEILLILNAVHNLIFYRRVLILPKLLKHLGSVYIVLFVLATTLKIDQQITALFKIQLFHLPVIALRILDLFWLLLAAIIPLFLSIYFRKKIPPITFKF